MIEFVKFNGVTLTDRWSVVNVERDPSKMTTKSQTVQGRPGAVFMGTAPAALQIRFTVLVKGQYSTDRREESRRLRAVLQTDEPQWLEFSDDGGLHYLAILNSIKETRYKRTTAWAVTMDVFEPFLLANETKSKSSTNGSLELSNPKVDGTAAAYPLVTMTGAVPGSAGYVELKLDGGEPMRVPISVNTGSSVSVDCDPSHRAVAVDGAVTMLTTDSDFWALMPGVVHEIAVMAGSASTLGIEWRDRWEV